MKRGVVISDSHAGNIFALTPPDYWRKPYVQYWEPFWEWYVHEAKQIGKIDFLVHNAESIDGPGRHETIGLWTTDVDEQAEVAAEVIDVWNTRRRYMTFGSSYHSSGVTKYDLLVADKVEAECRDEIRLEINGKLFRFRHVLSRSDTPYGQPSQIYKEGIRELVAAADDEFQPAEYIIGSHNHYYYKVETFARTVVNTPSLLLRGAKGVKRGSPYPTNLKTQYYHVGLIYIEVADNGEVDIRPRRFPMKIVDPVEYVKV